VLTELYVGEVDVTSKDTKIFRSALSGKGGYADVLPVFVCQPPIYLHQR